MSYKDIETQRLKSREAMRRLYARDKARFDTRDKKVKKVRYDLINTIKQERGCFLCSESDPHALEVRRAGQTSISCMVSKHQSVALIRETVQQGVVICGNCSGKIRYFNNQFADTLKQRKLYLERRRFLNYVRYLVGCSCGERHPGALHFHHLDKDTKTINCSHMVNRKWSYERMWEEIQLCDILCVNCHRKHHKMEQQLLIN